MIADELVQPYLLLQGEHIWDNDGDIFCSLNDETIDKAIHCMNSQPAADRFGVVAEMIKELPLAAKRMVKLMLAEKLENAFMFRGSF